MESSQASCDDFDRETVFASSTRVSQRETSLSHDADKRSVAVRIGAGYQCQFLPRAQTSRPPEGESRADRLARLADMDKWSLVDEHAFAIADLDDEAKAAPARDCARRLRNAERARHRGGWTLHRGGDNERADQLEALAARFPLSPPSMACPAVSRLILIDELRRANYDEHAMEATSVDAGTRGVADRLDRSRQRVLDVPLLSTIDTRPMWTSSEHECFVAAFCVYGKNFARIALVVGRSIGQCAAHYYEWKHTSDAAVRIGSALGRDDLVGTLDRLDDDDDDDEQRTRERRPTKRQRFGVNASSRQRRDHQYTLAATAYARPATAKTKI